MSSFPISRFPLLLFLIVPLFTACSPQAAEDSEPPRLVKTLSIELQSGSQLLSLPGEVHARHEAPLAFRVGGKIIACPAELGVRVRSGELLARLQPEDYRLAVKGGTSNEAQAHSTLVLAEADLKRFRELRQKGVVSAAALDQKQAAYDAARAALDAIRANASEQKRKLSYTALTADADGVVTALDCNVGQVVAAGQPVVSLAHDGAKEIAVHVPESSLATFRRSPGFDIKLNANSGKTTYHGVLRELAGGADPATRTYAARITVSDADDTMQLGMSAVVRMRTTEGDVIRLPLSAVFGRDGSPGVWKVSGDGVVHRAPITVAGIEGDELRVSAGLAPGDQVVTAGANLLREGEKVRIAQ